MEQKFVEKRGDGLAQCVRRIATPSVCNSCPADLQTNCCHESRCSLTRIDWQRYSCFIATACPPLLMCMQRQQHGCLSIPPALHQLTPACLSFLPRASFSLKRRGKGGRGGREKNFVSEQTQRPEYTRYCLCLSRGFNDSLSTKRAPGQRTSPTISPTPLHDSPFLFNYSNDQQVIPFVQQQDIDAGREQVELK